MDILNGRCSICNGELTPYGNYPTTDGIICRNCVRKLSPFLTREEVAQKTTEDIRRHLEYRSNNLEKLKTLQLNKVIDEKFDLLTDNQQYFLISRKDDYLKENPDIIPLDDITDIKVTKTYFRSNPDAVDVNLTVTLKNSELDRVRFRVNEFPGLQKDSQQYDEAVRMAYGYKNQLNELIRQYRKDV